MELRIISAKDTYSVRLELLRNNSPISHEFSRDNDSDTFHLGVFSEGNIVSVSSYMKISNNKFRTLNTDFVVWQQELLFTQSLR